MPSFFIEHILFTRRYLNFSVNVNACTFYHEHIIIPFHIVTVDFNKNTALPLRDEYYSMQVHFYSLCYMYAISLLITP